MLTLISIFHIVLPIAGAVFLLCSNMHFNSVALTPVSFISYLQASDCQKMLEIEMHLSVFKATDVREGLVGTKRTRD